MGNASSQVAPKTMGLAVYKPENVFATAPKNNLLVPHKRSTVVAPQKVMVEAERIRKTSWSRRGCGKQLKA